MSFTDVNGLPRIIIPGRSRWGRFRDQVAWAIATFAFTVIATEWYSNMIEGSIRYGLKAAREDSMKQARSSSEGATSDVD